MLNELSNAFVPTDLASKKAHPSTPDSASFVDAAVKDAWTASLSKNTNNEGPILTGTTLPLLALTSDGSNRSPLSEVASGSPKSIQDWSRAHDLLTFAPPPTDSQHKPGSEVFAKGPERELTYQQTTDGHGHQIRIGSRNGVAVYCQDSTGEWDSTDGQRWVKRGTNDRRIWHGSASISDNGNYTSVNSDSGVTTVTHADGTTSRSITGANGQRTEIRTNAQGVPVYCADSTGTWTSTDGQHWTNTQTGRHNSSTVQIDHFGQYIVKPEGGAERVEGRSRELNAVMDRQAQLTRDYGVVFPKPGEKVRYDGKDLTLRPPTMEELDCVSDVLQRNRQMNMRGLKLSFVESGPSTDDYGLWGVYMSRGADGHSGRELMLFPKNTQIRGWNGLEGTLEHELVHHEQSTSWGEGTWGRAGQDERARQTRQLMLDFGWVHDQASGQDRLLDKEHPPGQWQFNAQSSRWDPVIGGHPEPGRSITSAQMRDRALVKPATNYFNYPWEMHAEALSMFRHDRHQLYGENRQLYQLMQQYDQREINRQFGSENGQPRMIRGANGLIVPNTEQNRRAVTELEHTWQTTALPTNHQYAQRSGCCGGSHA